MNEKTIVLEIWQIEKSGYARSKEKKHVVEIKLTENERVNLIKYLDAPHT